MVFEKKIEIKVRQKMYNLNLKEEASENIKITEDNIERGERYPQRTLFIVNIDL